MFVRDARQRNGEFEDYAEGPNDPKERPNYESESDEPAPRRTHEQEIRDELRKQQHFHQDVNQGLRQGIPRSRNKDDYTAGGLSSDDNQPKIREQPESGRSAGTFAVEVRLNFGFKDFEMRMHVAGRYAAE